MLGTKQGRCAPGFASSNGALFLMAWITALAAGARPAAEEPSGMGARAVTAEDLLGIVDIGVSNQDDFRGVAASPDGTQVAIETRRAILARNAMEIRWQSISLDGSGKVIELGDGGEPITFAYRGLINGYSPPQRPLWSPDSKWIIYRARRDGETQLWRSRRDGEVQEQLTWNMADVESFRWSSDETKLFFVVGTARSETADSMRKEGERGYLYDERFAPYHSRAPLIPSEGDPFHKQSLWVYVFENQSERLASDAERHEYSTLMDTQHADRKAHTKWIRHASNGAATVWLEDLRPRRDVGVNPSFTVVGSTDSAAGDAVVCRISTCTGYFKGLWISADGGTVFFLRWVGPRNYGDLGLYSWKLNSDTVVEVLRTGDLLEGCAHVVDRLICAHESPTTPKKLVSIDLAKGRLTSLFDPNLQFQKLRFGEVTALTWQTDTGIEGFGHLVKPTGYHVGRRYPLVVVQYVSRGFLRGGVGDEYPVHVLAVNGFVVLNLHRPIDWALEANSKTYDEVEEKGWVDFADRRMVLSVLEAGVAHLDKMGIIDPARVGITGLSDGGETVAFALIHAPNRFAAAAASGTWWNPIIFYLAGPKFQPQLRRYGLGLPETESSARQWKGVSLALNAQVVNTPILLQVSDLEFLAETHTVAALKEFGKAVEMHVFPNEFHIKAQPVHRYNIYRRNVQWFKFWLSDTEEQEPVDAGQYRRWRSLRESQERYSKEMS